jgi:hypothetical protein
MHFSFIELSQFLQHQFTKKNKLRALIFVVPGLFSTNATAQSDWPNVALPDFVSQFNVGEEINSNGLPMQVHGFLAAKSAENVLDWFRKSLGRPIVESHLGRKTILGQANGHYFITVQVESSGKGSKGIVAVTDILRMVSNKDQTRSAQERFANALPANSKILNQLSSQDGDRVTQQITAINAQTASINRNVLINLMAADGYQVKSDTSQRFNSKEILPPKKISSLQRDSSILMFEGNEKYALAVLFESTEGGTVIVLSTSKKIGQFK